VVLQGVHHVLHAPVALKDWPDADHRTRVVLILQGADPGVLAQRWAEFLKKTPGGLGAWGNKIGVAADPPKAKSPPGFRKELAACAP
jgi:hypothetical protein